jgi:hypothetical protein
MEQKLSSMFYVAVGAVWADVTTDTTVLTVAVVAEVVADANVVVATTPDADIWAVLQHKTTFYL